MSIITCNCTLDIFSRLAIGMGQKALKWFLHFHVRLMTMTIIKKIIISFYYSGVKYISRKKYYCLLCIQQTWLLAFLFWVSSWTTQWRRISVMIRQVDDDFRWWSRGKDLWVASQVNFNIKNWMFCFCGTHGWWCFHSLIFLLIVHILQIEFLIGPLLSI